MRENKYRAWIKEYEFMCEPDLIDFNNNRIKYDSDWYESNKFEIMQYTGVRDKNDVEIYDGDIIKDTEENLYVVDYDNIFAQYVLKEYNFVNINGKETYKQCDYNCFDYYLKINKWGTVVGNIYENSELLER